MSDAANFKNVDEKPLARPKRERLEHPSSISTSSYSESDFMRSRRSSFFLEGFRQRHSLNLLESAPGALLTDCRKSLYLSNDIKMEDAAQVVILQQPDHTEKSPSRQPAPAKREGRPASPKMAIIMPLDF